MLYICLPESGNIRLDLFDVRGRHVKILEDGFYPAGMHQINWDGTDKSGHAVTSGIYIARLTSPSGIKTIRFALLK